jgi:hypothetical protein
LTRSVGTEWKGRKDKRSREEGKGREMKVEVLLTYFTEDVEDDVVRCD